MTDKLREALEFYADPFKWKKENNSDIQIPDFYNEICFGEKAEEALASDPWQPIETAPKDGSDILALKKEVPAYCVVSFVDWADTNKGGWWNGDVAVSLNYFDYWQPLPKPPEVK